MGLVESVVAVTIGGITGLVGYGAVRTALKAIDVVFDTAANVQTSIRSHGIEIIGHASAAGR
jgi:hypothetical protein